MALRVPGMVVARTWVAAMVVFTCSVPLAAQPRPASKDQKPDPAAQAQAMAQQQEIQNLVRVADGAMSGQQAPADFPIQFQNDFLKAQGTRVWVPITLTIDPAKLTSSAGAMTLYLRVVPRGTTAPPAPPAPDKNARESKDKDKKPAPPAGPAYPYEDASFMDVKPAGPGQPIRIMRGIGVPAGSYDLYIVLHERPAGGTAARRPPRPRPRPRHPRRRPARRPS